MSRVVPTYSSTIKNQRDDEYIHSQVLSIFYLLVQANLKTFIR